MIKIVAVLFFLLSICQANLMAEDDTWYTQGDFEPKIRLEIVLKNDLNQSRTNCPIVINRADFPLPDLHEMWVTVVDPSLPAAEAPSPELLSIQGGHQLLKEENGHAIYHQLDDLDRDGLWDELFFQTDMNPNEVKKIYVYIGENIRGWNKHATHANIGSYCRHQMPFWESENVGWKIWFANSVDVYAKRAPVLMSDKLYMENIDGYGVSHYDRNYGSDIQSVAKTFGGGAICLFEHPAYADSVSMPRFTPVQQKLAKGSLWNAGQISDTRYAYEVVVNGPIRSMIKVKTMNWNTENGSYELEQYFTAYANQSYSSCKVNYTKFSPKKLGVTMGCGIRKKPGEEELVLGNGMIISSGAEGIRDPENIDNREDVEIDFVGKAIVVKNEYNPEYQFVKTKGGNHALKVMPDDNNSYEFMIFAAWSDGAVFNTKEDFESYVKSTALGYNNPVELTFGSMENKND